MIIDCISDLHGHYPQLEGGDLLIVAGDLTARDTPEDHAQFGMWLMQQGKNYKQAIVIAGNHDNFCQIINEELKSLGLGYLCDSGTEFEGLKIWGSPWTKRFPGMNPKCMAFTVETEEELAEKWALIPQDTDILVTHSPPHCIFDQIEDYRSGEILNVGSLSLLMKATSLKNLKLFVFGHIHEGYGMFTAEELRAFADMKIAGEAECKSFPFIVNASHVNEYYEPVNKPIRIEI